MDESDNSAELMRLSKLHDEFLRSLEPNRGLNAIHVASGCQELGWWLLERWDREITSRKDFVYISDAHYKRSGFYIDYDSLLGIDYDDLVDALFG
ncbi:hypothetical protein [uncultured Marinobacter sp.]|uniref:hypothetical protein n=1 Tax=uncultured Marinobacter sp. TaxID=187379 RepID=UPI002609E054|nr:hypothetical protein [uncultured Marinobacter sp.]